MLINEACFVSLFSLCGVVEVATLPESFTKREHSVVIEFNPIDRTYTKRLLADYLAQRV